MKKLTHLIALALCLLTLASCSANNKTTDRYSGDSAPEYSDKGVYGSADSAGDNEITDSTTADIADRKLIRNVDLTVETKAFDSLIGYLTDRTESVGGYIEQSRVNGNSYDTENGTRYATVTCRIPADRLDEFLSGLGENCNIVSRTESVEDVTLSYVDLESRINALETEKTALLALLEKAESTADILAIQSQLTDVIYRLESATASLRALSDQVDYSTVILSVQEVRVYTEADEPTVWEKISTGFMRSLVSVGTGIVDFIVFLIVGLPFIVLFSAIGIAAFFIVRTIRRRRRSARTDTESKP